MKWTRSLTIAALAAAVGAGAPMAADAQQQVPPVEEEQVEVTDELLERFVKVYPAVVNVAEAAQNQLAVAETAEEAQEIQAEAQMRVSETLEEGGVTPLEYESVVAQLNDDPALMAKFEQLLAEEGGADGGN